MKKQKRTKTSGTSSTSTAQPQALPTTSTAQPQTLPTTSHDPEAMPDDPVSAQSSLPFPILILQSMQKGKKKATDDPPADVQMADPEVQMAPPAPDVTLWCVLEGDPPPFRLSVPPGTDVDGLKEQIKKKNAPELDHLPSRRLRLFKVCTFRLAYSTQLMRSWKPNTNVPLSPGNTLLSRLPAVESWQELEEHHEVLSVLKPLLNHLHIIVRRPPDGECKCLVITVILTMSFHDLPSLSSFTGHLIPIDNCTPTRASIVSTTALPLLVPFHL